MIKIQQLKLHIKDSEDRLYALSAKALKISVSEIKKLEIAKKSLDARKKPDLFYIYTVNVWTMQDEKLVKKCKNPQVSLEKEERYEFPNVTRKSNYRPVIVGMGPAGLFCGYYLARAGLKPILLERGKAVEERSKDVEEFWEKRTFKPESNVQFGEGGAGTFSDGKLNTLVKDKYGRNKEVLRAFTSFGAPKHILYENKPHIGTDVLSKVVANMRNEIIALGGEVCFESKLTDLVYDDNGLKKVIINDTKEIETDTVVLALGHSARDTFTWLYDKKLPMEAKPFAIGVRAEHKQEIINKSQYGEVMDELPAAAYKIAEKTRDGRGVYSFCMCPGGYVVNASSEENMLCINGMSYSRRDGKNANAAIIVTIDPKDYGDLHPLSGMKFQRKLEKAAYELANGSIPVQTYQSFVSSVEQKDKIFAPDFGKTFEPAMKGNYEFCDITSIFPDFVKEGIIDGMEAASKKIHGFNSPDTLLSAVESRTSSPLRMVRDDSSLQSGIKGIYPCGEGAGYAGGITSAAMDGIKVAEAIAQNL